MSVYPAVRRRRYHSTRAGFALLAFLLAATLASLCASQALAADELLAGTSDPGRVYRYDGGTSWTALSPALDGNVLDIVRYQGSIFAATSTGYVYRSADNGVWMQSAHLDWRVFSLAVYGGHLYAGAGCQLFCYQEDGTASTHGTWQLVVSGTANGMRALEPWRGQLYIGDRNSDYIYRWNGVAGSPLELVFPQGGSCIWDFEPFQDVLYAGAYHGPVYRSNESGTSWSRPFSLGGDVWALRQYAGGLYFGTGGGGAGLYKTESDSAPSSVWSVPSGTGPAVLSLARHSGSLYLGLGADASYFSSSGGQSAVYRWNGTSAEPVSTPGALGSGVQSLYGNDETRETFNVKVVFVRPKGGSWQANWNSTYFKDIADDVVGYYDENSMGVEKFRFLGLDGAPNWSGNVLPSGASTYSGDSGYSQFLTDARALTNPTAGETGIDAIVYVHSERSWQTDGTGILTAQRDAGGGMPAQIAISARDDAMGTWAHELGHALGALDTYNIQYGGSGQNKGDAGKWDLMARGNTNDGGPSQMAGFTKTKLGWLKFDKHKYPETGSYSATDLPDLRAGDAVFRYDTLPGYYVAEARTPDPFVSTWDNAPGEGLALFYVSPSWLLFGREQLNFIKRLNAHSGVTSYEDVANQITFQATNEAKSGGEYTVDFKVSKLKPADFAQRARGLILGVTTWVFHNGFWWLSPPLDAPPVPSLDLHAYTADGRHVGINYETDEFEVEIPGVKYSGDRISGHEWILIPPGVNATFVVGSSVAGGFFTPDPGTDTTLPFTAWGLYVDPDLPEFVETAVTQGSLGPDQYVESPLSLDLSGPAPALTLGEPIPWTPDAIPPLTSAEGNDDLWHNAPVTLRFSAADNDYGSGMVGGHAKTEYKLDDGVWTEGTSLTVPAPPNTSCIHTAHYRSVDRAGNVEANRSLTVKIDTIAPQTTAQGVDKSWYRKPVTISFAADDPGQEKSGVAFTEYKLDAGEWTQGTSLTIPAPPETKILHTVLFRSADNAGNREDAQSLKVGVTTDTTPLAPPQPTPTYVLTPSVNGGHGTTSPAKPLVLGQGTRQAVIFYPDAGYRVDKVLVDGKEVTMTGPDQYTFKGIWADHTIEVSFVAKGGAASAFTVTPVVSGGQGAVSPAGPQGVPLGATPTFRFAPADGYQLGELRVDGEVVQPTGAGEYTFPAILADHTIAVTFTAQAGVSALTAKAPSALTVKRGRSVALPYGVFADGTDGTATVTITIQTKAGKVVARKAVKDVPMNVMRTFRLACRLNRGTYQYLVAATSSDGRSTLEPAVNTLRVL